MIWIWILVILGTLIFELVTYDLVSIWFTLGGVIALCAELIGLNEGIQIVTFVVSSLGIAILARPFAKKAMQGEIVKTNLDRLVGKKAVVTKVIIDDNRGEVRVDGSIWMAVSLYGATIEEGKTVVIRAIEGAKLLVIEID